MAIIGFIGLGVMGKPMAKNLIKAGYKLIVHDKLAKLDELLSMGAEGAVSSREVASKSDIIITMLPNLPQLSEAMLGAGGVIEGLKGGSVVVDMSSVTPELSVELAAAVKAKNAVFMNAAAPGGEPKAVGSTLTITGGGDKAGFEKIKPIMSAMGISAVHQAE